MYRIVKSSILKKWLVFACLLVISTIMHWRVFTLDLMSIHVWRQTETQTTINNFYEEDFNILNPRKNNRGETDGIFRMEFPLMQWLYALAGKVFGNTVMLSRILTFILGFISLAGMYTLLKTLTNNSEIGLISAWTLNFSPSFFYYTVNPIPDNFALVFAIWGTVLFFKFLVNNKRIVFILALFAFSTSALVKLPFIIFFVLPGWYIINYLKETFKKKRELIIASFLAIVPVFLWYINVIPEWRGNGIVSGILNNEKSFAEWLDILQANLFSVFPELLINYGSVPFLIFSIYFIIKNKKYTHYSFPYLAFTGSFVFMYFIFELNMIGTIHDYYLFPFLPFLFILIPYGYYKSLESRKMIFIYITIFILLILPITCWMRMTVRWNPESPGFNKDLLLYKNELRNVVPDSSLVVAGNDISGYIFFYYIDKKGWNFNYDQMSDSLLQSMIKKGADYLYSDSRSIENNPGLTPLLDSLILEAGSIKVFKLKEWP